MAALISGHPVQKSIAIHFHLPYIKLDRVTSVRTLRSGSATTHVIRLECGTFQEISASLFNNLPANLIRASSDFKIFCREVRTHILRSRCNQQQLFMVRFFQFACTCNFILVLGIFVLLYLMVIFQLQEFLLFIINCNSIISQY